MSIRDDSMSSKQAMDFLIQATAESARNIAVLSTETKVALATITERQANSIETIKEIERLVGIQNGRVRTNTTEIAELKKHSQRETVTVLSNTKEIAELKTHIEYERGRATGEFKSIEERSSVVERENTSWLPELLHQSWLPYVVIVLAVLMGGRSLVDVSTAIIQIFKH